MFVGFLPDAVEAHVASCLSTLRALPAALVFYEAPHRVRETVASLAQALGGERMLVVARELTKKFEEIARLPLAEGEAWFEHDANRVRGEFVLVVDAPGKLPAEAAQLTPEIERWLAALLVELPPSAAARVVASVSGVAREIVYERATALKATAASVAYGGRHTAVSIADAAPRDLAVRQDSRTRLHARLPARLLRAAGN